MSLSTSLRRAPARFADAPCAEPLESRILLAALAYAELPMLNGSTLRPAGVGDEGHIWGEYDGGYFFMESPTATPIDQQEFVSLLEPGERIIDADIETFGGISTTHFEWHFLVADDNAGSDPVLISIGEGMTPQRIVLTGLPEWGAPTDSTFGPLMGVATKSPQASPLGAKPVAVVLQRERTGPDGTVSSTWLYQDGVLYYVFDGAPIGINDSDTIVANGPAGHAWLWSSSHGVADLGAFIATGFSNGGDHGVSPAFIFGYRPEAPGELWVAERPGPGPLGSPPQPRPVEAGSAGGPGGADQIFGLHWDEDGSISGMYRDSVSGQFRAFVTGPIAGAGSLGDVEFIDLPAQIVNAPAGFDTAPAVELLWHQTAFTASPVYIGRFGAGGEGFILRQIDAGTVRYEVGRTATTDNNSTPARALQFEVQEAPLGAEYEILVYDASETLVLTLAGTVVQSFFNVESAGDQALADGAYTYRLRVEIGGAVHTSDATQLIIDTVAPVFTSTPPATMPVTFRYDPETNEEGAEFGVGSYEWQFQNGPFPGIDWGGGSEMAVTPPASVLDVPIEVTVVAVDGAGNRAEQTFTFTVTGEALFFPEGFTGETIDEFLAIVNPHDQAVQYRVNVYYEAVGWIRTIAEGTIAANSRGGVTVSTRDTWDDALVAAGQPYSFEVIADAPITVSLSHYDFGSATSETFTSHTSQEWLIPGGRLEANVRDFIVWHSPNQFDGQVSVHFYADDGTFLLTKTVGVTAGLRGGLDVTGLGLPPGRYTAHIVATVPIVASLTQYLTSDHPDGPAAHMSLGIPDGGATSAALPLILAQSTSTLRIHNPGASDATIAFTFTDESGAAVVHNVVVAAGTTAGLSAGDVAGLAPGARYSLSYASDLPVAVVAVQRVHDDLVGTPLADAAFASEAFFFADGFMNPDRAGVDVFETVAIYNPDAADAVEATVTIHFTDGFTLSTVLQIDAGRSAFLDLHEWQELLDQGSDFERFFYSVEIEADGPVIAGMWHFDLTLGGDTPAGGFAVLGAPVAGGIPG